MMEDEKLLEKIENAAREGARVGATEALKGKNKVIGGIGGILLSKLIPILALVVIVLVGVNQIRTMPSLKELFSREEGVEGHDMTLENNGILGYKVADFAEVILGESTQLKKLEVYSQEMSQVIELTKAGLGGFKVFSKSKFYTYHGTAIYTVDLGLLKTEDIELDEENQTVILKIPHTVVQIDVPIDKMEIGDMQKGLLAFGDLNMTDEEQQELYVEAKSHMEEKLVEDNIQEKADRMAKLSVWEIYNPLIKGMAKGYSLEVQFVE